MHVCIYISKFEMLRNINALKMHKYRVEYLADNTYEGDKKLEKERILKGQKLHCQITNSGL